MHACSVATFACLAPVALSTSMRTERDRAYYFFLSPRVPGDGLKMYARERKEERHVFLYPRRSCRCLSRSPRSDAVPCVRVFVQCRFERVVVVASGGESQPPVYNRRAIVRPTKHQKPLVRELIGIFPSICASLFSRDKRNGERQIFCRYYTTLNGGSLGSWIDEERSKVR